MKRILIIIIILSVLLPTTVLAFSFTDLFYFFDKKPEKIVDEAKVIQEKSIFSRYSAETKYEFWKTAYDNQDIRLASDNSDNLVFSEGELNYLIARRLKDVKYPPVDNLAIKLKNNLMKVSGCCLKRFFNGDFELDIEPINKYGRLSLEVKRARFKGIFFPKFIASLILRGEMKETIDFLHSNPDFAKLTIKIVENELKLIFEK